MNDFFTDLDTDLHGAPKTPHIFRNPPKPTQPYSPTFKEKNVPVAKPMVKKQELEPSKGSKKSTAPVITPHIAEVRAQMMETWVVVIVFKADEKSKTLLGHLKLETRGFAYLDEVREVHKMVIKKARASYEDTIKDIPDIEEKDLIKIIRRDLELFLVSKLDRNPLIIPIIIYV